MSGAPIYRSFWGEDLGRRGDVTTRWLLGTSDPHVTARVFARHDVVASGVAHARSIFEESGVEVQSAATDGAVVRARRSLLRLSGSSKGVLAAERIALNILGRMCAIATYTKRIQQTVSAANPACRVAATRKTTPGFRAFEKQAVVHGGGDPNRTGLYDMVLIKDNHRALIDDLGQTVGRVVRRAGPTLVEVEVENATDAVAAACAGAAWLLIDNQTPANTRIIAAAARAAAPSVRIEASGGIREDTVARYAPFCDRISLGALTHSVVAADVTLELKRQR